MSYSEEQLNDMLRQVRNRFFFSAGVTALSGAFGLYWVRGAESTQVSDSAMLFCGFIVGFFLAGILIPQGFTAQLKKEQKKKGPLGPSEF